MFETIVVLTYAFIANIPLATFSGLCYVSMVMSHYTTQTVGLGPVQMFACVSFSTGNLNCFRVK